MKYKVFLFDADNTLYDYDAAELAALTFMFAEFGFTYDEIVRERYREINSAVWAAYERGEKTSAQIFVERFVTLLDEFKLECPDIDAFSAGYLHQLGLGTQLVTGALEICKHITGCGGVIHIITNGMNATQKSRIALSPLTPYISQVFTSEALGYQKPDTRFFEHVFAHIPQKDKTEMLVVGDSLRADIAGGNAAGLATCWLNLYDEPCPAGYVPTYEIRKLHELEQFI